LAEVVSEARLEIGAHLTRQRYPGPLGRAHGRAGIKHRFSIPQGSGLSLDSFLLLVFALSAFTLDRDWSRCDYGRLSHSHQSFCHVVSLALVCVARLADGHHGGPISRGPAARTPAAARAIRFALQ
jgi:hypothetical protein